MTLHLPEPLTDDEDSKDDRISFTHPNLNMPNVLDSIRQGESIRKKLNLRFWVRPSATLKH